MPDYKIIRSNRKSIALQITRDLKLVVRAPLHMADHEIAAFVRAHQQWVDETLPRCAAQKMRRSYLPEEELALRTAAKELLPQRVAYFSSQMGLQPTGIKITSAQTRFGSCNGKNSLCFSWRLMAYPQEAVDYVIVHELAHIVHKNHSKAFYAYIARYLPDYKARERLLQE